MAKRTIGALARETGVSVETVRFYERKGLIAQPPKWEGPRTYDDSAVAQIRYVRVAQTMGLSLAEIKSLKAKLGEGKGFCASVRTIIAGKLVALAEERRRIEGLQSQLEAIHSNCLAKADSAECPVLASLRAT